MDSDLLLPVAIAVVVMLSVGLASFVLLSGGMSSSAQARIKRIGQIATDTKAMTSPANTRKKSVQEALKDLETQKKIAMTKASSPPLNVALEQAAIRLTVRQFIMASAGLGVCTGFATLLFGQPLWLAFVVAIASGLSIPRMLVTKLRKRRQKKFIRDLPEGLDVLIRGLKAGLSVQESLRIVATETDEPLRGEFRIVVDELPSGLPLDEVMRRMAIRMPVPEANYLAMVMAIQNKAGGNLAEAIGNLSRVLRERKRLDGRVKALSAEATSSAMIIGVLPILVSVLIYFVSPSYIMRLFTDPIGHLALGGSAVWMGIGIYVMRQMIQIDV